MDKKEDINNLLTNIQRGLELYSVSELNEAIVEAINKKDEKSVKINRVAEAVSDIFNIKKRTLLSTAFRGQNKLPAAILIVFLRKELDINHRYMAKNVFNINASSESSIFRIITQYKTLNVNIKKDAEFLNHYEKVKAIING